MELEILIPFVVICAVISVICVFLAIVLLQIDMASEETSLGCALGGMTALVLGIAIFVTLLFNIEHIKLDEKSEPVTSMSIETFDRQSDYAVYLNTKGGRIWVGRTVGISPSNGRVDGELTNETVYKVLVKQDNESYKEESFPASQTTIFDDAEPGEERVDTKAVCDVRRSELRLPFDITLVGSKYTDNERTEYEIHVPEGAAAVFGDYQTFDDTQSDFER